MVFTRASKEYFSLIQQNMKQSHIHSDSFFPFHYDSESFFTSYEIIRAIWKYRRSQRDIAQEYSLSRNSIKHLDEMFSRYGCIGLLTDISVLPILPLVENIALLAKRARPHETASYTKKIIHAYGFTNISLDTIREIHRSWGFGQRLNEKDHIYWNHIQQVFRSITLFKKKQDKRVQLNHAKDNRAQSFLNFESDPLQHRIELFIEASNITKQRKLRPLLKQYGVHPNRFCELRKRFLMYGIWGLIDLVQTKQTGTKISDELELLIIEERLMDPALTPTGIIRKLDLKCSRSSIQKIFKKWNLNSFKQSIKLRGIISRDIPGADTIEKSVVTKRSIKAQYPQFIIDHNLKTHKSFDDIYSSIKHKCISISNPGALITAPFLDSLGIVEAAHTYGPSSFHGTSITNSLIVNIFRIIVGYPTIHDFTQNSDRSVALASGLSLNPKKSRYYDMLDELRFSHLEELRNDLALRAKELTIIEGKEIAIDYHCDPADSRYPYDKLITKSPDKNGDVVYAYRPQIIWDAEKNSIINIAYHEGRSRAPSALYKFCEKNLFSIIEPDAIHEIFADSEYTGEKQLVYLLLKSDSDVTMCLKQNRRIKKWRELTIKEADESNGWTEYEKNYVIATKDFELFQTARPFRFVVKEHKETGVVRCFGSTHMDQSARQILERYHMRWPVETGIKNLIEDYFLNNPTGTSPEKIETHYYCIMAARYVMDFFLTIFAEPTLKTPEDWVVNLNTIRNVLFSNQNCQLRINDEDDFVITYLDGDKTGLIGKLQLCLDERKRLGLNSVAWWGGRGILVEYIDQYQ